MMATYIYAVKVNLATFLCCKPEEEARLMWFAKKITGLPLPYWEFMLKGSETFLEPHLDYDTGE